MKCKVNIRSEGGGWKDERSVEGEMLFKGGVTTLRYRLEGDLCTLVADSKRVEQKRVGNQCVDITFIENEYTQCKISNGGFTGSFEIYTRSLQVCALEARFELKLIYSNGGEEIILNLCAEQTI